MRAALPTHARRHRSALFLIVARAAHRGSLGSSHASFGTQRILCESVATTNKKNLCCCCCCVHSHSLTHSLTDDHYPGTHTISTDQLTDDNHAYFVSRLECGNPDALRCCDGRARLTALLASGLVTLLDGSSPQAPVQSLHELCRRRGVL